MPERNTLIQQEEHVQADEDGEQRIHDVMHKTDLGFGLLFVFLLRLVGHRILPIITIILNYINNIQCTWLRIKTEVVPKNQRAKGKQKYLMGD